MHFVDGSNLGAGHMFINNGGTLALHTTNATPIKYTNTAVLVSVGNFVADRSYQSNPLNTFSGGMDAFEQTDGGFFVDNGVNAAQATFTGNNGFNFGIWYTDGIGLSLGNGTGTHTITVNTGVMTGGRGGFNVFSVPANGLNMSLTTVLGDTTGGPLSGVYRDSGSTLFKDGQGVFEINVVPFNQQRVSTGIKQIDAGVLRFSSPVNDPLTGQVLLNSASSAVGVGYDGVRPG